MAKLLVAKFLASRFGPDAADLASEHGPGSSAEKMLFLNARDCAVVFSLEHDVEKPAFGLVRGYEAVSDALVF